MNAFWTAMFAATAAVSFTLASFAATQGQDKVQPSFDCTKSVGVVEKAICGSEGLSRLDGDMSVYFKLALEWLSGADAAALRADQRAWLSTGPVLLDTGMDSLKAGMQKRITALQGTVLNAFPLLGEWVNHATSVLIRDRGGLIVEFRDEHCGNLGGADYAGDADRIVVHTGEDDKAAQNASLRISRRGPFLLVEEMPPARRGKIAPERPCPGADGVVGLYLQKSRYLKYR